MVLDKRDWGRVRARYEAWWQGELFDRPLIRVTAPTNTTLRDAIPTEERDLQDYYTNPERVLPRLEREVQTTYWGGDAFPVVYPMSMSLVAIQAAYLGCPYQVIPGSNSAWATPIIDDWNERPELAVEPDNAWWRLTQQLLEDSARVSAGRYAVGLPDLEGGGQIVAQLRGLDRLALDLYDYPDLIRPAVAEVNRAWLHYYTTCYEIIHRYAEGYVDQLALWSDTPAYTVECDFAALISPHMFREFFLPGLEQQIGWVGRTIFHLDGPNSLPHLDTLLGLRDLNGIQWVPGAGAAPMSEWLPLLLQIQRAGKNLVLGCECEEVGVLLDALKPEGLLLSTACESVADADALVQMVDRRFGVRV